MFDFLYRYWLICLKKQIKDLKANGQDTSVLQRQADCLQRTLSPRRRYDPAHLFA